LALSASGPSILDFYKKQKECQKKNSIAFLTSGIKSPYNSGNHTGNIQLVDAPIRYPLNAWDEWGAEFHISMEFSL
jgi:hypothetical protein